MEDTENAPVLHFLFKIEMGNGEQRWGCRRSHGTVTKSPGMGGLANARPPFADRLDPWGRGGVATVCADAGRAAILPSDCHPLDHHWNSATDPGAFAARSSLAWRAPGFLRRGDDHR